jgi:hypothetical protein
MAPRESLGEALSRIIAWASPRAGAPHGHADDDDVEVQETRVSLRCPLSGMRVRRAGRITTTMAVSIFDLDYFLESAERTRKWQCPTSCAPLPLSVHFFLQITAWCDSKQVLI